MYKISKIPKILVVGDLMIDHYLWGSCERISPEAPVQVVDIKNETFVLGGAGNVISNLISLGASVDVASVTGDDENRNDLVGMLKKLGVGTDMLFFEKGRKTAKKSRIMASHQQIVRYDLESKNDISIESQEKLLKAVSGAILKYDLILISDYAKGVLTNEFTSGVIKTAKKNGKFTLIDPKGEDYSKYKGATLITPNKKEASIASRIKITDDKSLKEAGEKLKKELGLDFVIVTLSEDGMAIFDKSMTKIPTIAREVYDVTGAGDTVLAALGVGLSAGFDIYKAALFATSAAAVVVAKLGSATASVDEVNRYENQKLKTDCESKILNADELQKILEHKDKKAKIVFTNGCFDILHRGHVKYLQNAKNSGSLLIVGLNSDESVKRLKGSGRPVNNQQDRAVVLSSLGFVDYVVIFEEDTPYQLIQKLKPDILAKGADYKGKEVVGSDLVKEVLLIDFVENKSTTNIIKRIQKQ
ncbi:MAG: D-glycero-beta-D-manno-heptose-7-phosphate kinase [Campylobacteraceae bacterium]|jgi:D-beta-D-heptose 7-phosphate kinase/D-beta-D-heptose 1-phosphate adenosyltransferase|nr:D-glycero-beta-D-manno-heptose-7-phosphate kinase [Campylobacteraceae bacterium]